MRMLLLVTQTYCGLLTFPLASFEYGEGGLAEPLSPDLALLLLMLVMKHPSP